MWIVFAVFLLAGACLGAAAFVIGRHWKEIRLLDPLTIAEERARQKRETLMQYRFHRVGIEALRPVTKLGQRMKTIMSHTYHKTQARLQTFETVYKNLKSPFASMEPSQRERIKTLENEAKALLRDLKWADAERRYIEILSLDTRCAEAYKGLGQIYLKQRLFPQAKETLDFLIKIKQTDDAVYAALAEIAEAEGNLVEAEALRLKAVDASPRQAHRYGELAEFYLSQSEPAKAWAPAKHAVELEPKGVRYLETSLEVAILLGDRGEARKRLDRLRLTSDDQTKFQSWKRKFEQMPM